MTASLGETTRLWLKVGLLNFGGPAGQIAMMHRLVVDERKWLDEPRFLHALNYCMLLPGPEAQQLAAYIGWLMHGVRGGLIAGLLFIVPGALLMLALSALYFFYADLPAVAAIFYGIKAAVLAIVVEALLRIQKRALKSTGLVAVAAFAFAALFFFAVPFPLVILAAALTGYFLRLIGDDATSETPAAEPNPVKALSAAFVWINIWLLPIAAVFVIFGPHHVFTALGVFFSQMAVVTFGGAYAVLSYVAQESVTTFHWLSAKEMVDGLGMAETTPGPLILVLEYIGFLAGARESGLAPFWGGVIGAAITLWATFAPSFLFIFAGAPYAESLRANKRLSGAFAAVTAAVTGVILNLAVWFALHVLFAEVHELDYGPLRLTVPDTATLDLTAFALSLLAALALIVFRIGLVPLIVLAALAGLGVHYFGL